MNRKGDEMEKIQKIMDTEVKEKKVRRRFTESYKLKILQDYDSSTKQGEKGELLRREGLYSSTITAWRRKLMENAGVDGITQQYELENHRLKKELSIAKKIIDVQKKILEISEESIEKS